MKQQYIINTVKNGKVQSLVVLARDKRGARKQVSASAKIISINPVRREVNIYK